MSDPSPSQQGGQHQDRTNFSSSLSSHRLPTVSAATALASLESEKAQILSTNLSLLDAQLGPPGHDAVSGGLARGKVYEVYGPPGSGKTALGLQVAASALMQGAGVAWIDTGHPLAGRRLRDVVQSAYVHARSRDAPSTTQSQSQPPSNPKTTNDSDSDPNTHTQKILRHFTHIRCPTLAHLLALLSPSDFSSFPEEGTALIVLDTATALLPFSSYHKSASSQTLTSSARRSAARSSLVHAASQLAARRRVSVLLLCSARTVRLPSDSGGVMGLGSALGGDERVSSAWIPASLDKWKEKVTGRMVVFRDFYYLPPPAEATSTSASTSTPHPRKDGPGTEDCTPRPASFIALLPSTGPHKHTVSPTTSVPFSITSTGILPLPLTRTSSDLFRLPSTSKTNPPSTRLLKDPIPPSSSSSSPSLSGVPHSTPTPIPNQIPNPTSTSTSTSVPASTSTQAPAIGTARTALHAHGHSRGRQHPTQPPHASPVLDLPERGGGDTTRGGGRTQVPAPQVPSPTEPQTQTQTQTRTVTGTQIPNHATVPTNRAAEDESSAEPGPALGGSKRKRAAVADSEDEEDDGELDWVEADPLGEELERDLGAEENGEGM